VCLLPAQLARGRAHQGDHKPRDLLRLLRLPERGHPERGQPPIQRHLRAGDREPGAQGLGHAGGQGGRRLQERLPEQAEQVRGSSRLRQGER